MALPTSNDVYVDELLTNISVAYVQGARNFVSNMAFPSVPVDTQGGKYMKYDLGDFLRDEAEKRAPGTESVGSGFRVDTSPTYHCDVWAFHKNVDAQIRANQRVGNPDDDAARFVMQTLMIRKEREFNSTFMTGGVWDNDYDGTASSPGANETIHWSDTTSGDPIGDIRDAIDTVEGNTGYAPNTLILGKQVFSALIDHPDIVDRVKYSGGVGNNNPAMVNEQTLASLFGLDRVMVSRAVVNTAAEAAADSVGYVFGKDALLCYVPDSPGLLTPAAGYTFSWDNYLGAGNDMGIATKRIPDPHRNGDKIEGEIAMDMKLVSSALGFFWDGIVA